MEISNSFEKDNIFWAAVETFAIPGSIKRDPEYPNRGTFAMLHEGEAVIIHCPWGVNGYQNAGKVQLSIWPCELDGWREMLDKWGEGESVRKVDPGSIRVAHDKEPARLEADIRRRLCAPGLVYLAALRARIEEYQQSRDSAARFAESIAAACGLVASPRPAYQPAPGRYEIVTSHHTAPGVRLKIETSYQNVDIELNLSTAPGTLITSPFSKERAVDIVAAIYDAVKL